MLDEARELLAGKEAWLIGGAIRDELLGRPVDDVDISCPNPREAAVAFADRLGGDVLRLPGPNGAWRVELAGGRTADFTPFTGRIETELAARDFTANAIARPLAGGDDVDPFLGRADIERRVLRAVADGVFAADPLRLLRAARLEDQLGFRIEPHTEELMRRDAPLAARAEPSRIQGELEQLSPDALRRLRDLGVEIESRS